MNTLKNIGLMVLSALFISFVVVVFEYLHYSLALLFIVIGLVILFFISNIEVKETKRVRCKKLKMKIEDVFYTKNGFTVLIVCLYILPILLTLGLTYYLSTFIYEISNLKLSISFFVGIYSLCVMLILYLGNSIFEYIHHEFDEELLEDVQDKRRRYDYHSRIVKRKR